MAWRALAPVFLTSLLIVGCGGGATTSLAPQDRGEFPDDPVETLFIEESRVPSQEPSSVQGTPEAPEERRSSASSAVPQGPDDSDNADGVCDPNYSGACVPLSPTDLDCMDVQARVQVVGRDIHELDADADGFGCESYG